MRWRFSPGRWSWGRTRPFSTRPWTGSTQWKSRVRYRRPLQGPWRARRRPRPSQAHPTRRPSRPLRCPMPRRWLLRRHRCPSCRRRWRGSRHCDQTLWGAQPCVCRRQSGRPGDDRRGGAGAGRGYAGQALRRARRAVAGPDAVRDRAVAACRGRRPAVYITNMLPWRPPQNRDPTPEEISMLQPFVQARGTGGKPDAADPDGQYGPAVGFWASAGSPAARQLWRRCWPPRFADVPPGLPVAQPGRQARGLGRSAVAEVVRLTGQWPLPGSMSRIEKAPPVDESKPFIPCASRS
jgi:hypothetical protein